MSVPTVPLPHFILVETDLTFRRLDTFLNRPADHGDARGFQEGRRARAEDVVGHDLVRIAQPSAQEHPMSPASWGLIREWQPGPVIHEEAFRTRTDRESLPVFGWQRAADRPRFGRPDRPTVGIG